MTNMTLNMKRFLYFLLLLCLLPPAAFAHNFESGGIYYDITSSSELTCEVTFRGDSYDEYDKYEEYFGTVIIPSSVEYDGKTYSVTSIGDYAFYDCSSLASIEIPNSVTSIGEDAFYDCSSLASITIPNSVTSIGDYAFYGCNNLHSVIIGSGVLSVGKNAFPSDYDEIEKKVIWLPNTPPKGYKEIYGTYNYASNDSYSGLRNVTVYPYLSSMFETGGVKYVPVSPSERTCVAIDCAYDGTKAINIGKTVSYQGITMNVIDVRPSLCYDNDSIETVNIEGYEGNIGDGAFYDCDKLAGIDLPNSVTSIGTSCFAGCNALVYAYIGSGISELPASCFRNCGLQNIVIPNTISGIGEEAFNGCVGLTSIIIPNSVTNIGSRAFANCGLTDLRIEDGSSTLMLGSGAFSGTSIIYIGRNFESSNGSPFDGTYGQRFSVTLSDLVTYIDDDAFGGCEGLTSITIPNSVTSIGDYAFRDCSGLTSVMIPNSVKSIGYSAFFLCIYNHRTTKTNQKYPSVNL